MKVLRLSVFLLSLMSLILIEARATCHIEVGKMDKLAEMHRKKIFEAKMILEENVCLKLEDIFEIENLKLSLEINEKINTAALANENNNLIELAPLTLFSKNFIHILSHELFHLYFWKKNSQVASWYEEGLAELFAHKISNSFNQEILRASMMQSHMIFFSDYGYENRDFALYGNHFLYFYYLDSKCSVTEKLFKSLVTNIKEPINAINSSLAKEKSPRNECQSFSSSYIAYTLARSINRRTYSSKIKLKDSTMILKGLLVNSLGTTNEIKNFLERGKKLDVLYTEALLALEYDFSLNFNIWIQKRFPYEYQLVTPEESELNKWILISIKQ